MFLTLGILSGVTVLLLLVFIIELKTVSKQIDVSQDIGRLSVSRIGDTHALIARVSGQLNALTLEVANLKQALKTAVEENPTGMEDLRNTVILNRMASVRSTLRDLEENARRATEAGAR